MSKDHKYTPAGTELLNDLNKDITTSYINSLNSMIRAYESISDKRRVDKAEELDIAYEKPLIDIVIITALLNQLKEHDINQLDEFMKTDNGLKARILYNFSLAIKEKDKTEKNNYEVELYNSVKALKEKLGNNALTIFSEGFSLDQKKSFAEILTRQGTVPSLQNRSDGQLPGGILKQGSKELSPRPASSESRPSSSKGVRFAVDPIKPLSITSQQIEEQKPTTPRLGDAIKAMPTGAEVFAEAQKNGYKTAAKQNNARPTAAAAFASHLPRKNGSPSVVVTVTNSNSQPENTETQQTTVAALVKQHSDKINATQPTTQKNDSANTYPSMAQILAAQRRQSAFGSIIKTQTQEDRERIRKESRAALSTPPSSDASVVADAASLPATGSVSNFVNALNREAKAQETANNKSLAQQEQFRRQFSAQVNGIIFPK